MHFSTWVYWTWKKRCASQVQTNTVSRKARCFWVQEFSLFELCQPGATPYVVSKKKKNTGLLWSRNNGACLREVRGKGALFSEQGCSTTQHSCLLSLLLMLSFLNGNKLLCPSGDHLLSQSDSSQLLAEKKKTVQSTDYRGPGVDTGPSIIN